MNQSPLNWDDVFVGRRQIIEKLSTDQGHYFIFGARRIGKTSLLKFFEKSFWEKSIPAFYFSIQGDTDPHRIIRKIENAFRRKSNQFKHPEIIPASKNTLFDFLDELDSRLNRQKIIFLIDEIEQIHEIEKQEAGFIEKLRNAVESSENIRYILTASPHFKRIVSNAGGSAFLSAFNNAILPIMTQDEICELIHKLIPKIKNDVLEQILNFTHYQPYLVKIFLGKLLKDGQLQRPSRELAQECYITNVLDGIFPNYLAGLSVEEQNIVRQIQQKKFSFKERYETKLKELEKYGYLKIEQGRYVIPNWFFEHWLSGETSEKAPPVNPVQLLNKSKFAKVTDYFQVAANKLIVKIVLIIIALIITYFLGNKIGLLDLLKLE